MTTKEERMPSYKKGDFHCPYCDVYTVQTWANVKQFMLNGEGTQPIKYLDTSQCYKCKKLAVWYRRQMIDPLSSSAPQADDGMPDNVREIYDEARDVSFYSSRAASALLRLALEELTKHLGESEGTLNARIGNLRKRGVSDDIIDSLDIVRITANDGGVHSGEIDLTGEDGTDTVDRLFWLVNRIVKTAISERAKIKQMFQDLPANKREGIETRDKEKDKT